jgi:DNA-binding XRE family transcriptional regulator
MGSRRGRPRSTTWIGKLGEFVNDFTVERLACELDIDVTSIYAWARGDARPQIQKAIAIAEIARAAGTNLSLEDIYVTDVARVRIRMRSPSSP